MCTCRDDQYQLCFECNQEQFDQHSNKCTSCGEIIACGTLCLECGDDIAITENKAFALELMIDNLTWPDLTNKCCVCRTGIDKDEIICSNCNDDSTIGMFRNKEPHDRS